MDQGDAVGHLEAGAPEHLPMQLAGMVVLLVMGSDPAPAGMTRVRFGGTERGQGLRYGGVADVAQGVKGLRPQDEIWLGRWRWIDPDRFPGLTRVRGGHVREPGENAGPPEVGV